VALIGHGHPNNNDRRRSAQDEQSDERIGPDGSSGLRPYWAATIGACMGIVTRGFGPRRPLGEVARGIIAAGRP
jgi:hypothetical protein